MQTSKLIIEAYIDELIIILCNSNGVTAIKQTMFNEGQQPVSLFVIGVFVFLWQ